MRVKVIAALPTAKGIIPAGRIIEIPDQLLAKLTGKVEAINDTEVNQISTSDDYHTLPLPLVTKNRCQARKVGARVCGAPLKAGVNGWLSCSDPACQVPAIPHGLVQRKQRLRVQSNVAH